MWVPPRVRCVYNQEYAFDSKTVKSLEGSMLSTLPEKYALKENSAVICGPYLKCGRRVHRQTGKIKELNVTSQLINY